MGGVALDYPLLGPSSRIWHLCRHLLDHRSHPILHRRKPLYQNCRLSLSLSDTTSTLGLEKWSPSIDGRLGVRSLRQTIQLDAGFRPPHYSLQRDSLRRILSPLPPHFFCSHLSTRIRYPTSFDHAYGRALWASCIPNRSKQEESRG